MNIYNKLLVCVILLTWVGFYICITWMFILLDLLCNLFKQHTNEYKYAKIIKIKQVNVTIVKTNMFLLFVSPRPRDKP